MKNSLLQRWLSDRSGSILMLVGLSLLFLFGIAGAGYDLGRQQLVRQKIQQASDASALAAAGLPLGTPTLERKATAQRYFQLNYPTSYLGVPRMTPTVTVNTNDVEVKAEAPVTTNFVVNLGINSLTAKGLSDVQFKNEFNKVDLILVLDNSGSMGTNTDVGTTNSLNAGTGALAKCLAGHLAYGYTTAPQPVPPYPPYCYNTASCCTYEGGMTGFNRMNALRYSATDLTDLLLNPNPNNNTMAVVTWDLFLMDTLAFTNNPTPVKNFLSNNMYGRGQTNSNVGMQKAYNLGLTGFRPSAVHAVILMTDGANYTGGAKPDPTVIANTLAVCRALKNGGTLVYTVGFGGELSNSTASSDQSRQFLSDCATDNDPAGTTQPNLNKYYYVAADATALHAAFNAIKGSLQSLRIVQ